MSGTSLDGIDVALVEIEGTGERPDRWRLVEFATSAYAAETRAQIRDAIESGSAATLCALDFELGHQIGRAVLDVLDSAGVSAGEVAAVGSHGQTVWHIPPAGEEAGATLQIGQASVIAEVAGCDVVSDFRTRDMAAGGHGAPLTAHTDWLLFQGEEARLVQNIGGIANVTALPGSADTSDTTPQSFDTGPGVALLDGAVETLTGGRLRYDDGGKIAAAGAVSRPALDYWLDDPYFALPPPKTTGRERFGGERLRDWLTRFAGLTTEDLVATLTELTARTIAESYRWIPFETSTCYLCGGGANNPALAGRLAALAPQTEFRRLSALGADGDSREAVAFALLARQHVLGYPGNASWATGASGARQLGSLTRADGLR